jgi:4-amino-4-deoxy-L-arabinose transferase-like glycosyltransferase
VKRAAPRVDPVLIAVLLLGACFLFANLGQRALWTDEAETALLARNVMRFGLPLAFDGVHYVSQQGVAGREDFGEDLLWVLSPWLQLYVAAGSFAALGESPLAARLPFALAGLASVLLLYRLARTAFGDRRVARLAALLLVCCVPFLLHARQCRYYPLVICTAIAAVHAYLRLLQGRPRAALWLTLSLALLFHSNYGAFIPLAAGLALHGLAFARPRPGLGPALAIGAGVAASTAPWALYARIDRTSSLVDPSHFAFHLLNHLIVMNNYLLPFAWLAVVWFAQSARGATRDALGRSAVGVIACIAALSLVWASINANFFFRYVLQLVPLLVLVHAALLVRLADLARDRFGAGAGRAALAALVVGAVATTLPALPSFALLRALEARAAREPWADDPLLRRPRAEYAAPLSELFDFVHEITHEVRGPDSALAGFLAARAGRGDLVFADYGDLPLIFATGLAVRGGTQGVPYLGEPDWIVPRAFEANERLRRFAQERGYREHVLDVADTRWENIPDPYSHEYRDVPIAAEGARGYPPLVVFEHPRRGSSSEALAVEPPRAPPPARHERRPNILLVSIDSLRADRVADAGSYFLAPTRLGRFAAESTLFTTCRSTATGTAAAAASLLTGLSPSTLGGAGVLHACPADAQTLAERFAAAGYETAAVVPNAALPAALALGFEHWLAPPAGVAARADFAVAREARHWMLSRDGMRPWLLWVHLNGAHGPYRVAASPFGTLVPFVARVRGDPGGAAPLPVLRDNTGRGGVPAYQEVAGARSTAHYRALHDTLTQVGDFFAGELLDTLRVASLDASTVVAIAGTHGESLGEQGVFFNHGENLDESVLRVPLVVRVPGAPPAVIDAPVSIADVAPTLLALAGQPAAAADGVDLSAACRGAALDLGDRAGVASELARPQGAADLLAVSGRRFRVESDADGALRAFELAREDAMPFDPRSRDDAELAALVALLERRRARPAATPGAPIPLTQERRAALVELGYVEERLP